MSEVALLVSVVSLLGTLTTVVRLFTKTEVRVEGLSKSVDKVEKLSEDTAYKFVNEGKMAHMQLEGRVKAIEDNMAKLASNERVNAVLDRMEQGFKHLEDVIRREIAKSRED